MKRYHLSKDLKEVKEPAVQLLGRGKACAKGLREQHIQPRSSRGPVGLEQSEPQEMGSR